MRWCCVGMCARMLGAVNRQMAALGMMNRPLLLCLIYNLHAFKRCPCSTQACWPQPCKVTLQR